MAFKLKLKPVADHSDHSGVNISTKYKNLKHREHVLLRNNMYIGQKTSQDESIFIYDSASDHMKRETIKFNPALYQIVEEILMNSRDACIRLLDTINKQTLMKEGTMACSDKIDLNATYHPVTHIKMEITHDTISVMNDGMGIDVCFHPESGVYVPELIFCVLLSGENFDDENDKRTWGGMNGMGAKLTNIFSTEFIVETCDSIRGKKYIQRSHGNMEFIDKPVITKYTGKPYTKITFKPDFARFGLTGFFKPTSNLDTSTASTASTADSTGLDDDIESVNTVDTVENKSVKSSSSVHSVVEPVKPLSVDDETIKLIYRRMYDISSTMSIGENLLSPVSVYLNGDKLKVKTFQRYIDLYVGTRGECKRHHVVLNKDWEIVVCASPNGTPEQVSFVNGISCDRGGRHVDYIRSLLSKKMHKFIEEHKKLKVVPSEKNLIDNMWVFINCTIVNPVFDTQTKQCLTTPSKDFQTKCVIPDDFVEKLCKPDVGIIEGATKLAMYKLDRELKKTDGDSSRDHRRKIPKLFPAEYAGHPKYKSNCVLILTEGDSARSSLVSSITALPLEQRKFYGTFPLRGKVINTKDVSISDISKNAEFVQIKQILGLEQGVDYSIKTNRDRLNYGCILMAVDADLDAEHILALVINVFHTYWPALLKANDFMYTLKTPTVVATLSSGQNIPFYSLQEFKQWQQDSTGGYKTVYYKGLGTSTKEEAQRWFVPKITKQLFEWTVGSIKSETKSVETSKQFQSIHKDNNLYDLIIKWNSIQHQLINAEPAFQICDEDVTFMKQTDPNDVALFLAFGKVFADHRKTWIDKYLELKATGRLDYSKNSADIISYDRFVLSRLVQFSVNDNVRSIPSLLDGLKPSHRKCIYTCLKYNISTKSKQIKLSELGGKVSSSTDYHHGEVSLHETLIGLAQTYTGSNNVNLLVPQGQYGTRLSNGKDSGAPRYIHTYMTPYTTSLFDNKDDYLLWYNDSDGKPIEPWYYVPILPIVLFNGSSGIGTGWSTDIPAYNPHDVIAGIRNYIKGEPVKDLVPWYRNFKGRITSQPNQSDQKCETRFKVDGVYTRISGTEIHVTELPVGTKLCYSFMDYYEYTLNLIIPSHGELPVGTGSNLDLFIIDTKIDEKTKKTIKKKTYLRDVKYTADDENLNITLVFLSQNQLDQLMADKDQFEQIFKLSLTLSTTNMHLFDANGQIKRYMTARDILIDYAIVRMDLYNQRLKYMIEQEQIENEKTLEKIRFIEYIIDETHPLKIQHKTDIELLDLLTSYNFKTFINTKPKKKLLINMGLAQPLLDVIPDDINEDDQLNASPKLNESIDANDSFSLGDTLKHYEYLLAMRMRTMTVSKLEKLRKEQLAIVARIEDLLATPVSQLWLNDIDEFVKKYPIKAQIKLKLTLPSV